MTINSPMLYNLGINKQFLNPKMNVAEHKNIRLNSIKVNDKHIRNISSRLWHRTTNQGIQYNPLTKEPQLGKRLSSKKYNNLDAEQKASLRDVSCSVFLPKKKSRWLMGCFEKPAPKIEAKKINTHVFEVINFLEDKGKTCKYIFRVEGNREMANELAFKLDQGEMIPLSEDYILETAAAMKAYIRDFLNGIVPLEVARKLFHVMQNDLYLDKLVLSTYLPFVFTEMERDLIKAVFRLIKAVDENQAVTLMSADSCLSLFSLGFFPAEAFTHLDMLAMIGTITKELYDMDFDTLPSGVLM